ncbi:MAG: endolytic transglycosylase MltG, partial [Ktedonobacterales bacterium]
DTTASVATNLAHDGLIRNSTLFRVWARYRHLDRGIEPGVYKLSPSMTMDAIIKDLQKGKPDEIQVQVMDSSRVEQYPAYFTGLKNFNAANFLKIAKTGKLVSNGQALSSTYWYVMPQKPHTINALEGYLYPDTYNMDANANEEDAINTMLRAFGEKLCPGPTSAPDAYILDQTQCKAHAVTVGDKTQVSIFTALEQKYSTKDDRQALYDALTLGSIVTRETPNFDPSSGDTQGIANVYYNRYLIAANQWPSNLQQDVGTLLGSDPTVQYAQATENPPKAGETWWPNINSSDPKTDAADSQYNTYVNSGLPPGPIAAPVWTVLAASSDPNPDGQTQNLYFLNDTCAGHHTHYATNSNDFEALKTKYLVQKQC